MRLRDLFIAITVLFWAGVGFLAAGRDTAGHGAGAATGMPPPPARAPRPAEHPALRPVTSAELLAHATPGNCWVAIDGVVYDLTDYIDLHPSKQQEMEGYCGKDGTRPWDLKESGKDRGKPHTERAAEMLAEYPQVGRLAAPTRSTDERKTP